MVLSQESITAIHDLIENRLAMMQVSDREDLRQIVALKRALAELHDIDPVATGALKNTTIPTRGRRRKVADMVGEVLGADDGVLSA